MTQRAVLLRVAAALFPAAACLHAALSAQVLLEEPRRLVLDSLLPRPKAPGEEIRIGDAIYRVHADPMAKGGGSLDAQRWPEGRVPFLFSQEAPLPPGEVEQVRAAMRTWEERTGGAVSFEELGWPSSEPYLEIRLADDNSSYVGRSMPGQPVHFQSGATWGTYLHELGHALGLEHEQNRSDRDRYVQVFPENVVSGMLHNFALRQTANCSRYDFASVMHYGPTFFSSNGLATLLPQPEYAYARDIMGLQADLTPGDAAEVRSLYTGVCEQPDGGGGREGAGGIPTTDASTGDDTGGPRSLRTSDPARWVLRGSTVPAADVRRGWNEGLEIVTSARTADEQFVVMSASLPGVRQSFQDAPEFPAEYVRAKWDEGYRIQHAVHGVGGWQVLMADGLGWGAQSWRKSPNWPKEEIQALWDEGKRITTVAHGDGQWFVALTEGTGISAQGWDTSDAPAPNEVAERRWADGFRVTGLAWGGGSWVIVSSQGTDLDRQTMYWGAAFPEQSIRDRWTEGYEITALARSDAQWVVVMSHR